MNPKKLADAYRTLSMGYGELADAYIDDTDAVIESSTSVQYAQTSETFHEGSLESCPRHHKEYRSGKVTKPNPSGRFCATKADDAWSYNGWCSINPTNAAEYLRQAAGQ